MKDIIRDSTVGQFINRISGGKYLPYADQRLDYKVPAHFILPSSASQTRISSVDEKEISSSTETTTPPATDVSPHTSASLTRVNTLVEKPVHDYEKGDVKTEKLVYDPYLVGWNGDDDPENPRYVHL
jgi:MFS transporter, DHA1 family, multidrug resistance protein